VPDVLPLWFSLIFIWRVNNKSVFKGVSWNKHSRKWLVYLRINGKSVHLGGFDNPVKAAVSPAKRDAQKAKREK
jgi:AP2 domain